VPIVQSSGALRSVSDPAPVRPYAWPSAGWHNTAYAQIYTTQPNVRTCVDFLARNIAQLGYHIFRRVSDTDRERLTDHELAQWLTTPNPSTSRYRLFESLVCDLGIYFNAYWLKLRQENPRRIFLVRLPPEEMEVEGGLLISQFVWTANGQRHEIPASEICYFNGYNPLNPLAGISPLETLRRVLAEEAAAVEHRELYWRNASRMEGVIERPREAPRWTPEQKREWRKQWQDRYHGPQSAGSVAVLEDGMTFKQTSFTPRESEYSQSRKLTREEVAAEYHIPLPMVGILDHATFSNIKEQHKQLYADCLGPWLEVISQEIERQLLPECRDTANVYTEFNIADKLKGSFEEQAAALRALVGRPLMTANEGRARLNLPSIKDDPSADELAAQQGGPADAAPALLPGDTAAGATAAPLLLPPANDESALAPSVPAIVRAHWQRQASRLARIGIGDRAEALNHPRSQLELTIDLAPLLGLERAAVYATRVTDDTYTLLCEGKDAFTDRLPPQHLGVPHEEPTCDETD
jgi:HK97 family phage portal protein